MSNPSSIAAATATLRNLLARVAVPLPSETDTDLSDTMVTTLPPDKAGQSEDHNQINLFLYQAHPNPAARNLDNLGKTVGPPALAIDLFYMVTVYGRSGNDILSHRLLGRAMSILHSYPILSPDEIAIALPASDLSTQRDRLRINPHSIPNEEMVRLWSNFQVKYRLSVVYRLSAILIDHEHAPAEAAQVQSVKFVVGATGPRGASA